MNRQTWKRDTDDFAWKKAITLLEPEAGCQQVKASS